MFHRNVACTRAGFVLLTQTTATVFGLPRFREVASLPFSTRDDDRLSIKMDYDRTRACAWADRNTYDFVVIGETRTRDQTQTFATYLPVPAGHRTATVIRMVD
ncbi:hypothetical protein ZHAS_00012413 [Anopheles sinensis]|uniref:Uncharacterized protein n=1 Tax=Anopheles sinensis TaxID=74873 RepID=A0A084W2T9_ANOSI|nr:hypothetical protein ZHAS_00012413 [Anopheles sinensis]